MRLRDTIAAISTPPGRGGIGIVRISGPNAKQVARSMTGEDLAWQPWTASLAPLLDSQGHAIDHVIVTFFAAPKSYTAEDVVEIACH